MPWQRCLLVTGAVFAMTACGSTTGSTDKTSNTLDPPTGTPSQAVTVEVQDNYYNPSKPLVAIGGTVTWTWVGNGHSVTSDGTPTFTPNAPISNAPRTLGPVVFATAGAYSFHCTVHGVAGTYGTGTMTGAVFVR